MNKKETTNPKDLKNQNYEAKKMNTSSNSKKKKDKDLPWWVELLFVQIGLPDKLLIKILKVKKTTKEFFKNDKNFSLEFTFQSLFDQGYDILIPMLIGSLIVSIPVWFISYFTVKFLISSFKKRKV